MDEPVFLGEFELLVMLAVARLVDTGYGVSVRREILRRTGREVSIGVDLGLGEGRATVWTCDLTHGYVAINADYRS